MKGGGSRGMSPVVARLGPMRALMRSWNTGHHLVHLTDRGCCPIGSAVRSNHKMTEDALDPSRLIRLVSSHIFSSHALSQGGRVFFAGAVAQPNLASALRYHSRTANGDGERRGITSAEHEASMGARSRTAVDGAVRYHSVSHGGGSELSSCLW